MLTKDITLRLPETLYERLREQAEQRNHSIEQELLAVVEQAVPPDLEQALHDLEGLDDNSLWQVARNRFPTPNRKIEY
jgi:plasmid stability protein